MTLPRPESPIRSSRAAVRPLWNRALPHPLRGLSLAREKGFLLAWDTKDWLYILDHFGYKQSQRRAPGPVATGCSADDGSAHIAVGGRGEVWWLAPDLSTAWEQLLPRPTVAAALDPFGRYAAVADAGGGLTVFDRYGRNCWHVESPRPLHHLAFVPQAPFLLAGSDFGLVACFDMAGGWAWRDGLVAHIGSLAVTGDGSQIILACFTEGVRHYSLLGKKQPARLPLAEPCRLAAVSFDGNFTMVVGLSNRLQILDMAGAPLCGYALELAPVTLTFSPLGDAITAALPDGTLVGLEIDIPQSVG
jgi:hypothetical protein